MTGKRSRVQEDVRFRILRLLQGNPDMSQRELAAAVGISVGAVHYVLAALVEKGFVKFGRFTAAEDRRRYAYVLTPRGIGERTAITRHFLARKMEEYQALKAEIDALSAEMEEPMKVAGGRFGQ